ncbi:MAG: hypothetical protein ACRD28_06285 [Acidobacteriaceae bacterium]
MSAAAEVPVESTASPRLAQELWISFTSLLRSHVAMHSIAAPAHSLHIHSGSSSRLDVLGPVGKLTVIGPNAAGLCAVEFRPENSGRDDEYITFFFNADGLVRLEGLDDALELESAVEYLLRKVQA